MANEIAPNLCDTSNYGITHLNGGEGPENFPWVALGGKKQRRNQEGLTDLNCSLKSPDFEIRASESMNTPDMISSVEASH